MLTREWRCSWSSADRPPYGTKPLPEPMLTNNQWGLVALTWGWFHKKCSRWKLQIQDFNYISQGQMSYHGFTTSHPHSLITLPSNIKYQRNITTSDLSWGTSNTLQSTLTWSGMFTHRAHGVPCQPIMPCLYTPVTSWPYILPRYTCLASAEYYTLADYEHRGRSLCIAACFLSAEWT